MAKDFKNIKKGALLSKLDKLKKPNPNDTELSLMKELLDFKGQTKFDTLEDYFNKWEKINKNLMNLDM